MRDPRPTPPFPREISNPRPYTSPLNPAPRTDSSPRASAACPGARACSRATEPRELREQPTEPMEQRELRWRRGGNAPPTANARKGAARCLRHARSRTQRAEAEDCKQDRAGRKVVGEGRTRLRPPREEHARDLRRPADPAPSLRRFRREQRSRGESAVALIAAQTSTRGTLLPQERIARLRLGACTGPAHEASGEDSADP